MKSSRVRVSVGRNREAQLPVDRIVLATGVTAADVEEAEVFRQRSEDTASGIDLTEVWELAREESGTLSLDDLAELYWGSADDAARKVAILLYMDREPLYFVEDGDKYRARTEAEVKEILARRQREIDNAQSAEILVEHLSRGELPQEVNSHQASLIRMLREFAIYGDDYNRSASARSLLERVNSRTRDLQRLSFELLIKIGDFSPDEPLELERAGIGEKFSEEAVAEAAAIDLSKLLAEPHRKDFTKIEAVTIDDEGTQDRDDALSLESEADGVYRIGIHIADAGALIPPGGALDEEADRRMSSLYLPERKIPMLPPEISNGYGSLNAGDKRIALSLIATVTESGEVLDWQVTPSVIRSDAALSYEEADQAISDESNARHHMFAALNRVSEALRRRREDAGAIKLERPDLIIKVAESGKISVRVIPRSTPSRMMVTEYMILCNTLLAEFCKREELPAAYRAQSAPDFSDLDTDEALEDGPLRWYQMIRRMPPADLDTFPAPHGGLGVPAYIQATSPLRRFPDLIMQRQISHFLSAGRPQYDTDTISSMAQRAEVQ
ncbi:MAG: ribonuclease catalytic domain-containing protein, partial [Ardenticatenaceae bacterium]